MAWVTDIAKKVEHEKEALFQGEKKFFSPEEIASVKQQAIPRHVAIIMDGNRRWARKKIEQKKYSLGIPIIRQKDIASGHYSGAANVLDIVRASCELGIEVVTLFAFSTENWKRTSFEVQALLKIFELTLKENQKNMVEEGIRFHAIGDLAPFPASLKANIKEIEIATKNGNSIDLVVAFNYGGRDELCRAFKKMCQDVSFGLLDFEDISVEKIGLYLDTAPWKDPDLIIRTSGEMRVSNFLLWQIAYAEIYVTKVLWPDFAPQDLLKAVRAFQMRERRVGI